MNPSSRPVLRIGMLIGSHAPDLEGGAERQCRLLSKELISRGYSVEVLTFRHSWKVPSTADNSGLIVNRIGRIGPIASAWRRAINLLVSSAFHAPDSIEPGHAERRMRAFSFWFALPVVWLARSEFLLTLRCYALKNTKRFDIIHVHESGWLAGIGVALAQFWYIPVVCKESTAPALGRIGHDTPFRTKWDRKRRLADAWVVQTPVIRDELFALGLPRDCIHLIPNGVIIPEKKANPEKSAKVLYVGNLTQGSAWKAFDVLFDAWIRVVKEIPGACLTVVGEGDPEPWIRMLRREGVESSVHFTGRLEDPSQTYSDAGIFVLPSRIEGMSNALLEAMSWGLPSVVSDIPGNSAVIENEWSGLLVPANNANALAEAIIRLLNDPFLRSSMGMRARRKAEAEYNIHRVVDRLMEIYTVVLGGQKKAGTERQCHSDVAKHKENMSI